MQKTIPVTILTGFLWSGKTTLLNHILKNKQWYKIAVIENEYGEEAIDSQLIEKEVEELIEIKDWCMCCIVRWDLIKWVEKLLNSWKDIDYIIIEASWMSEPLPVAQTFVMEDFDGRTKLDSIVCVVDAENFHHKIVQSLHTTSEQIENAHFMILNKTENVDNNKISEIKTAIRKLNPYAGIIESNYCEVDLDFILDAKLFQEDVFSSENLKHGKHNHDEHKHDHDSHSHDKQQIEKYFFKSLHQCVHIENIKHFLADISDDVYRMKGFIHFKDFPEKRYILQKAWSCFTLKEDENWDWKTMESKIVFIWKNLQPEKLQDALLKDVFFI